MASPSPLPRTRVYARVDRARKGGIHLAHELLRHADACVAHDGDKADLAILLRRLLINFKIDRSALRRIFHRVGKQIHIDLPHAHRVRRERIVLDIVHPARKGQMLFRRHAVRRLRIEVEELVQLHRLRHDPELAALDA